MRSNPACHALSSHFISIFPISLILTLRPPSSFISYSSTPLSRSSWNSQFHLSVFCSASQALWYLHNVSHAFLPSVSSMKFVIQYHRLGPESDEYLNSQILLAVSSEWDYLFLPFWTRLGVTLLSDRLLLAEVSHLYQVP